MSQTALELLYNWFIIEKKKLPIGRDSDDISAANKVRLLLSQLNINYDELASLTNLQRHINESKNPKIIDAPDAIVQVRNAIVHSQSEKRKSLSLIPDQVKTEVLRSCIWYIEMTLLRILDYDSTYLNRCAITIYPKDANMTVPWIKNELASNQPSSG